MASIVCVMARASDDYFFPAAFMATVAILVASLLAAIVIEHWWLTIRLPFFAAAELLHDLWSVAPWMPPQTLGIGSFDSDALTEGRSPNYLMPLALLSHLTFWTDFTLLTAQQRRQTAWWISWYRAHRAAVGPLVYRLTNDDPKTGKNWLVLQPWHGKAGYVFAFRQDTARSSLRVSLNAVRSDVTYVVRNVRTGKVLARVSGARLHHGFAVHAPGRFSAAVLSVAPAAVAG